jgi:hypothetical protein
MLARSAFAQEAVIAATEDSRRRVGRDLPPPPQKLSNRPPRRRPPRCHLYAWSRAHCPPRRHRCTVLDGYTIFRSAFPLT